MSSRLVCTLLVLVTLATVACALDDTSAINVLQESYKSSKKLEPENRAYFLVRLVDASTDIAPAQSTQDWSMELFSLAFKLPVGWNRIASEKNALVPLARVNPILAFELLAKVEKPKRHAGELTEDVRADAATTIFPAYFKTKAPNALHNIERQARDIGNSGEYPYRAIGLVIEELSKCDAEEKCDPEQKQAQADDLLEQALRYYGHKSPFLDADFQFYDLLQSARFVVSDSEFGKGLQAFVKHLQSGDSQQPTSFRAEVHTVDGVYPFQSTTELLLFQIYPIVVKVDKPLSEELRAKFPWLQHANTEIRNVSASAVLGAGESENPQSGKRARERLLLRRIQHLREVDPVTALKDAKSVETEPDRSNAVASVIPNLAKVDRLLARDTYLELTQMIEKLPQGAPRLGGLLASAKAACGAGYGDSCTDYVGQAFDYGLQVFAQAEKQSLTQKQAGFLELVDAAQLAAVHLPQQTLSRINDVEDIGLRSYLLLYAAKGLHEKEQNRDAVVSAGTWFQPPN